MNTNTIVKTLNIDPNAFMLVNELNYILSTEQDRELFINATQGLNAKLFSHRRQMDSVLRSMRKEKMKKTKVSMYEFVNQFKIDPIAALSNLLVERIAPIHIRIVNERKVTAERIYELHQQYPHEYLMGLLIWV
ncbi:hypothetical protein D3C75_677370 [compost metagenome]